MMEFKKQYYLKKNIYIYIYNVYIYTDTRQGNTTTIEAPFLGSGCGRVV